MFVAQALKDSTEVETVDQKLRKRVDPEKWPIPGPPPCNLPPTDFSQLINCPEFIPGQTFGSHTGKGFILQKDKFGAVGLSLGNLPPDTDFIIEVVLLVTVYSAALHASLALAKSHG